MLLRLAGRWPVPCWLMTGPPRLADVAACRTTRSPALSPESTSRPSSSVRPSCTARRLTVPSSTTSTSSSCPTRRTASGGHDQHLFVLQRDEDPAEHAAVDVRRARPGDLHLERPALGLGLGHDLADRGVAVEAQSVEPRGDLLADLSRKASDSGPWRPSACGSGSYIVTSVWPGLTVSPALTFLSTTTPAMGAWIVA